MSFISKDEQILSKIDKNIKKIYMLYERIKPLSEIEIDDGTDGNALAQCVTNLYELTVRLDSEEVSQKLSMLTSPRIVKLRNISANDYDAVNWSVAKQVCQKIVDSITVGVLKECADILEREKKTYKDYTV